MKIKREKGTSQTVLSVVKMIVKMSAFFLAVLAVDKKTSATPLSEELSEYSSKFQFPKWKTLAPIKGRARMQVAEMMSRLVFSELALYNMTSEIPLYIIIPTVSLEISVHWKCFCCFLILKTNLGVISEK